MKRKKENSDLTINKMEAQGIIRKISIGDLKEGITYVVGQNMMRGKLEIEQILHDTDYMINFGINKYDVYVSEIGSDIVRVWKSFMNGQISIEYEISVEDEIV